MLTQIESIMRKISETQEELTALTSEINAIDSARLQGVVELTKKGLPFSRIWVEKSSHNCNTCYHPDIYTYGPEKGYMVLEYDDESSRGDQERTDHCKRLYLLDTGEFAVYRYHMNISFWQNDWNEGYQKQLKVLSIVETTGQFDTEDILEGIMGGLKKRLEKLGERTKAQKARIEKLRRFQIEAAGCPESSPTAQ